ncbi:MAG TPA: hypothetical protein VFR36_01535 [Sphingomicrobium sp.]|nr:hypothetical protein [Sphingomicrobium sp.]
MSRSIRFLGAAILAWAGVRALSLGIIPGTQALAFDASAARPRLSLPPIEPTLLPAIEPLAGPAQQPPGSSSPLSIPYLTASAAFAPYPVYVAVPAGPARSVSPQFIHVMPASGGTRHVHVYGAAFTQPGQPQGMAPAPPIAARQSTPSIEPPRRLPGLDRLSLTSWALMRNERGPDSLANSGTLGGSEAGARLLWHFLPGLAASLRTSAPVNSQRGAEAAAGVRYQPFAHVPAAVTLERRHGFKDYGRNAFALFAEGGIYGHPMPWHAALDGYIQAGVVDFNDPDWFVDGQLAVSRPLWRNLSGGFGVWGGAQPGLNRLDVGPRLSLKVGGRVRAHVDYRLNVVGNAKPGSGAVVTLAGDF